MADIRNAFGQLLVREEDTRLLMSQLRDGLTVIHHCGTFGLTGMPPTFGVVSRVLESGINEVITGEANIYADDGMGASHTRDAKQDLNNANNFCTALLGPDAVAKAKA